MRTSLKFLKMGSVLLFLLLFLIIGFYRFPNRDITLRIETASDEYEVLYYEEDINGSEELYLNVEDKNELIIQQVRFYGSIKSVELKSIAYGKLSAFIESVQDGEITVVDGGIQITGKNGVCIKWNSEGMEMLQALSKSFLMERLCLIEVALIICMILFIVFTALEEKIDLDNRDNHGPIYELKRFSSDIKRYVSFMVYAAKTDLKAEVANSYLNRLWWLLEPFFSMMVYVIVFGNIMGRSIENYATFVFSALLMWSFFNKTINYSVKLVRNNKDIVTKVYVPKFVLLISNMILNIFKLFFSLIVLVAMMFIFKIQVGVEILMVFPAYAVIMLLAFGAGMIFLHFGVYVDDLSYAVGILLNMLMFMSGIFYDIKSGLSEPLNTILLAINPVAMAIDTMRSGLLYKQCVNLPLIGIWFVIAMLLCCIGVHIVYKNENAYVKIV